MTSAVALLILLALAAAVCVVSGVYVLAGVGWALIASGACLFGAATFLRRGMTLNG